APAPAPESAPSPAAATPRTSLASAMSAPPRTASPAP
ncbi:acetyl-CoA carboxylase biotin carboxyl carrier protein subunit, partial [Streptomyces benahoarensis]